MERTQAEEDEGPVRTSQELPETLKAALTLIFEISPCQQENRLFCGYGKFP